MYRYIAISIALPALLCTTLAAAHAKTQKHSPFNTGFLGLNTIPNARMDEDGTVRAGLSTLDPYVHAYIGLQIAKPLYINLRQSAEISNINDDAKRLYPGVDLKLRLIRENSLRPEVAIGLQSAFGHKRMAGEFLALSKRYKDVDFTLGLGWGRYGTAGHIKNPLKGISPHFQNIREPNDENPNEPRHWFTGKKAGFFGGLEYFTPFDSLSIKIDYGADRYTAEQNAFDYVPPAPWSIGLSYSPYDWINAGIAAQGTDKVMARLSLQSSPAKWPLKGVHYDSPKPFYTHRNKGTTNSAAIINTAKNQNITLSHIHWAKRSLFAEIDIPDGTNTPQHIGRALRIICDHAGADIEEIIITPRRNNLRGHTLKIMRTDIESALSKNNGSPQEIWGNTEFLTEKDQFYKNTPFIQSKDIKTKNLFNITLENDFSLSEEDTGILYRSSLIASAQTTPFLGFFTGTSVRLNIDDNLENFDRLRPPTNNPIRSDINDFTKKRISLENAHLSYAYSSTPDFHTSITAGYLEESYAGAGVQLLYRPFKSRFAFGADIWQVIKRDPFTPLNIGFIESSTTTGHLSAWYDLPRHDITIKAQAGRFLATDIGLGLGLEKRFDNGAILRADTAISNYADTNLFGGTTHTYHNINLTLPLGSLPYIPPGSTIKNSFAPFGRDTAQSLKPPIDLYDITENFTLNHIAGHWTKILD